MKDMIENLDSYISKETDAIHNTDIRQFLYVKRKEKDTFVAFLYVILVVQ